MLNNFIYVKKKSLFTKELKAGNVLDEAIVFIEDTKEIWNHGTYFAGSEVDLSNIENSILNILDTKQDAITDLEVIRQGAAKGVTSVQQGTLSTVATSGSYNDLTDKLRIVQEENNLYLNYPAPTAGNWIGIQGGKLLCPDNIEGNKANNDFLIGYNKLTKDGSPQTYFTLTQNSLNIKTNNKTVLEVTSTGDGSKFLSNDGTYKEISDGSSAYPLVNHGTSDTTFALTPNCFHVWDEVDNLTLTIGDEIAGVANEYLFQFTSGSEPTTLILSESIKFNSDFTIEANKIYQISILNGLGTAMSWKFVNGGVGPVIPL